MKINFLIMSTFAVIKTGGKQYKVAEGDKLRIEKMDHKDGQVEFDQVLLFAKGDEVSVGTPTVPGAKVTAKVLQDGKADKKLVFRFKSKTRYKKKKGHRQPFTEIQIEKISA